MERGVKKDDDNMGDDNSEFQSAETITWEEQGLYYQTEEIRVEVGYHRQENGATSGKSFSIVKKIREERCKYHYRNKSTGISTAAGFSPRPRRAMTGKKYGKVVAKNCQNVGWNNMSVSVLAASRGTTGARVVAQEENPSELRIHSGDLCAENCVNVSGNNATIVIEGFSEMTAEQRQDAMKVVGIVRGCDGPPLQGAGGQVGTSDVSQQFRGEQSNRAGPSFPSHSSSLARPQQQGTSCLQRPAVDVPGNRDNLERYLQTLPSCEYQTGSSNRQ